MSKLKAFTTHNQMAVFVLLAYLISWAVVIPTGGSLLPHGPMVAAFIVLAVAGGRRGVSDLWQQMTHWRVAWRWFLIVPGIFIGIHLCALGISAASGIQFVSAPQLQALPAYLSLVAPLLFFGGQWEEPGWTGYVLRRFQERFAQAPLAATLATGIIRMIWHTPLLLYGHIPWYDYLFYSFAMQIILSWLYNRTGSVLLVMVAHLFSNLTMATVRLLFTSADLEQYWITLVITISIVAAGLVIATRGRLGRKPAPAAEPVFSA